MKQGPFIHSGFTTRKLMIITTLALSPIVISSIWVHGFDATILIFTCINTAFVVEMIFTRRISFDITTLLVGVILALLLPTSAPWWSAVIGAFIAIGIGKHLFGGFGQNIFNPAVLSRMLLVFLFPSIFIKQEWIVDGETGATILSKEIGATMPTLSSLLLGSNSGSLAQSLPLAVLFGGIILLVYKLIDWRVPLYYLATLAMLSMVLPGGGKITGHASYLLGNPLLQMVAGGSLITAFFLLTDPVTSPVSSNGRVVFAIIAGIFTMTIRYYTPYPDGAVFGVLLANATVPLIDNYMLKGKSSL